MLWLYPDVHFPDLPSRGLKVEIDLCLTALAGLSAFRFMRLERSFFALCFPTTAVVVSALS